MESRWYNEMIRGIFMMDTALDAGGCLIRIWKQQQKVDEVKLYFIMFWLEIVMMIMS